jgi:uncharacterized membrane protein
MGFLVSPSRPFVWHKGKAATLSLPAYATAGRATAINNHGDTCGYFLIDDPNSKGYFRRACAWINGQFIDLGTLPGNGTSVALDINDAREIVGCCQVGTNTGAFTAFIWRDGAMMNLTNLLPPGSMRPDIARAINNAGQIAGAGTFTPLPPQSPYGVAFRLTPALPQTPGDTNCSSTVNVDDLLNVIANWNPPGPVGGSPCDVNRDNRINVSDLLEVIINWTG